MTARYELERLGVVMEPDPADPREAWGVLNPACARGRDGELYLFPRIVAAGNHSRILRARVLFDDGDPTGVERLDVALEPDEAWERNARTAGVEDPRITFVPALDRYLMAYTAYGPRGPRIGLAVSDDLDGWERLGPVSFAYEHGLGTDLNVYDNKDAALFPEPVLAPDGRRAYAMVHRPAWDLPGQAAASGAPAGVEDTRPGIWISFVPAEEVERDVRGLVRLSVHRELARPEQPWEELKIGAGPAPFRTPDGWLLLYHGVSGRIDPDVDLQTEVRYSAGALLLDTDDVTRVLWRSAAPLLEPATDGERLGTVANVVFPTAVDERGDGEADVYYGMADARIGVARLRRLAE